MQRKGKQTEVQSNNITYALHSLGWKAFQDLCGTIAREIFGQTVQTFSDSHDGGRDGAFFGTWKNGKNLSLIGTFVIQCKFTTDSTKKITLKGLEDEFKKAEILAKKGLCDNYILFTNSKITGTSSEKIEKFFETIPGINHCIVYGYEYICGIIRESSTLRRLVPHVYGLGDLSQILDQRGYEQANAILMGLGDNLSKFVVTESYGKSAEALKEHGFVLLLGEPTCGKSTIAAALAIGALDNWQCQIIKVTSAEDFRVHWNINDPKQLFWVDDAFGATQMNLSSTFDWNTHFAHMKTAIDRGAKFVFTSRDYIYKEAKQYLKESAIPVIKASQVIINVENISKSEREQILYNHIKYGNQEPLFKEAIKPFLNDVVENSKFTPEIARRLGNKLFTQTLNISRPGIVDFVEHPKELLCDIIETLDPTSKSTIALLFMRGGSVESPICMTKEEINSISRLGGKSTNISTAASNLDKSLLNKSFQDGKYVWKFKHPTIQDAFASIIAGDSELLDMYLLGSKLENIFYEVSCGDLGIEGAKIIIPENQYQLFVKIINDAYKTTNNYHFVLNLKRFLSTRCDKNFLRLFLKETAGYVSGIHIGSYLYYSSDISLILRLHEDQLLDETDRQRFVNEISGLAVETPDSGFLRENIKKLMHPNEFLGMLERVKVEVIPNLESIVEAWESSYSEDDDPENYFSELIDVLNDYKNEFNEESIKKLIDGALDNIESIIEELKTNSPEIDQDDFDDFNTHKTDESIKVTRSIFDDVHI